MYKTCEYPTCMTIIPENNYYCSSHLTIEEIFDSIKQELHDPFPMTAKDGYVFILGWDLLLTRTLTRDPGIRYEEIRMEYTIHTRLQVFSIIVIENIDRYIREKGGYNILYVERV